MTARSAENGCPTVYNEVNQRWEPGAATCPRCGHLPTPEGYDHCVGHIAGAVSACCGHGTANPYVVFPDVKTLLAVCKEARDVDAI